MSGGFLKAEGLDPEWSVSPPGVSAIAALQDGSAHVVQSALSQAFTVLDKGEMPPAVHFAQVNEMDGFFLTGREADPDFAWAQARGRRGRHVQGRPAARDVQVRLPQGGHRLRQDQADLPRRRRRNRQGLPRGARAVRPAAGPVSAAASGRRRRARRRAGRPADRTMRLLQPGGDPRLARDRHGEGLHARLQADADLHERDAGRRDRKGGETVFPGHRPGRSRRLHRDVPAARLLDAACGDHAYGLRKDAGCLRIQRPAEAGATATSRSAPRRLQTD